MDAMPPFLYEFFRKPVAGRHYNEFKNKTDGQVGEKSVRFSNPL